MACGGGGDDDDGDGDDGDEEGAQRLFLLFSVQRRRLSAHASHRQRWPHGTRAGVTLFGLRDAHRAMRQFGPGERHHSYCMRVHAYSSTLLSTR